MQSSFRMIMRTGPSVGKAYPLDKPEVSIGRDLSNEIVINDPEISRRHARLFVQGNEILAEDLGSTNGTFVNGQRLMGPQPLRSGDIVTFGERLSMVFEGSMIDPDATVASPAVRMAAPVIEQQPVAPPPMRAQEYYTPPAASASPYTNQIPDAYVPEPPPAPAARRPRTAWLIAIIILVLMCLCVSVFLFFAPKEFWCLFPIWPTGACP